MFLLVCSEDWTIRRVSPDFLNLTGYGLSEVIGQPARKFLAGSGLLTRGQAERSERTRLGTKAGTRCEIWLYRLDLRLGDYEERVFIGEELNENPIGLDTLPGWKTLDSIDVAVWTQTQNGTIAFANAKLHELLGFAPGELTGKPWTVLFPSQERRWVEEKLRSCQLGLRSQYETALLSRSQTVIPAIVNARPIMKAGIYQGCIFTFTDITERKQAERETRAKADELEALNQAMSGQRQRLLELTDELAAANEELKRLSQAKSDFVAAVSHDLRTPLTTIIEGISLVEDGTLGEINEEQRKFLKLAVEDAERLNEFITDILDLAKIEAGKIVVNKVRVDVTEQVARAKRSYENYMREKGLSLVIDVPEDCPAVFGDAGHYGRVLMNFLSNAIKFTPAGGSVTIRAEPRPKGYLTTSVIDTGIGIPEDQQHIIFGKFEQVRRSGPHKPPGSGLGLSLCKQLVEVNGGTVGFESEENKGSRFFFTLAVYDEFADLDAALTAVAERAQTTRAQTAVCLFRPRELPSDARARQDLLAPIAAAIKSKVLGQDALRVLPELGAVVLIAARPEATVRIAFNELVALLREAGVTGVSAACRSLREVTSARKVLTALESASEPVT